MPVKFDYRRSRRVRLKRPAQAMITGGRGEILDLSLEGIGMKHDVPLEPGREIFLEFNWGNTLIALRCAVAATKRLAEQPLYRSGLTVVGGEGAEMYRFRVRRAVASMLEHESTLPPIL
jgi:hypothetical protein